MNPSLQIAVAQAAAVASNAGRVRTRRNAICHSPVCAADLREGLQRALAQAGSHGAVAAAAIRPGQGMRLTQRRNAMTGADVRALRLALHLPVSPSPTPNPTPSPQLAVEAAEEHRPAELAMATPSPLSIASILTSPDFRGMSGRTPTRGLLTPSLRSTRPPLARRRTAVVAHADFRATIPDGWLRHAAGRSADDSVLDARALPSPRIRIRQPSQPTVNAAASITRTDSAPFLSVMLGELDLAGERTRMDANNVTPYSAAGDGLNAAHTPLWSPSSARSIMTDASASPADLSHRRGSIGASAWLLSPLPVQAGRRAMLDWVNYSPRHAQF